jgi:hypothetical protein
METLYNPIPKAQESVAENGSDKRNLAARQKIRLEMAKADEQKIMSSLLRAPPTSVIF